MTECCENKSKRNNMFPKKFSCPVNKQTYSEVAKKTIWQHVKLPWNQHLSDGNYYFCDDKNCDVVYFGLSGSVINKTELRTVVGQKETSEDTSLCYCFGISKKEAALNSELIDFVFQKTKEKNCSCEVRNPSGRCCLKDFPKNYN